MSLQHADVETPPSRRPGQRLIATADVRLRTTPTPGRIARRRILITLTKWLLPIGALALLTTVALWPEFDQAKEKARLAFRRVAAEVEGGALVGARYNGLDERGRPYTLTAAVARRVDADRIDLTKPNGDITLENGTWLTLSSQLGMYMQKASQLDLWRDVILYRDDGTTMTTSSASIDLKAGAAAGSEPVHVEGPWGVLDAQGFTVVDKGEAIQFIGPAHVVLNGNEP
ncbi:MAG: LPS export ABC transporter periplasmic protein LptC [Acetobacteraceae bacterium]